MNRSSGLCGLILAGSLLGIYPAGAQKVTLDSCRNMALSNNKTIRMADEAIRGAG